MIHFQLGISVNWLLIITDVWKERILESLLCATFCLVRRMGNSSHVCVTETSSFQRWWLRVRRWFIWRSNDSSYTIRRTRIDISVVVKEEKQDMQHFVSSLVPFQVCNLPFKQSLCVESSTSPSFSFPDYGVQVCVKSIQRDVQTWCTLQLERMLLIDSGILLPFKKDKTGEFYSQHYKCTEK